MSSKKQTSIQHFFSKPTGKTDLSNVIQNDMLEKSILSKRTVSSNNDFSHNDISSPKKVKLDFTKPS
jgi:hypothetical protein